MITIRKLEYIVAVSEELSFKAASDRCFTTQPTLSIAIKGVEDRIGFRIFDRHGNGPVSITEQGICFIANASKVIGAYRELMKNPGEPGYSSTSASA